MMSVSEAREKFRKWREGHERCSEEVISIWVSFLSNEINSFGDEKWMVLEQVIIAALDTHNYTIAGDAICELKSKFPDSNRVKYFQILRLQAMERYDEALAALNKLIEQDPTNSAAYKRKVAIYKSQDMTFEAIKELTEYLGKFMSDQEAWSELCDLYLSEGDYNQAVFCAEELILHNPHSFFVYQRAADIRYSMGGVENIKISYNYYSQAFKLNEGSMRSLFGIFLAGSYLNSSPKVPVGDKKEFSKTTSWAAELLCVK